MKDKMAARLYDIVMSKKAPDETADIDISWFQMYVLFNDIMHAWQDAGLDEEYFDEWFEMYAEPFRFLDYRSCLKMIYYCYETEYFDRKVIGLSEKEEPNPFACMLSEEVYSQLVGFCEASAYLKGKEYTERILAQVKDIISQ